MNIGIFLQVFYILSMLDDGFW